MITVYSRVYADARDAKSIRQDLVAQRFPPRAALALTLRDGEADDALRARLAAAHVDDSALDAYVTHLKSGGGALVVQASYKPLGAARIAREAIAASSPVALDGVTEEHRIPDQIGTGLSIFDDHRHMFNKQGRPGANSTNFYMADWPIPLINRRKPNIDNTVMRNKYWANWPFAHISKRKPNDNFAFPRHARMANWPIRLISKRKPKDRFAFPRHARMANFPIPLLSKRKPKDRFAFPRHQRMATWPFPLLINGQERTNALMPGAPRMADKPIPLLSKRTPSDRFAFPRHARMANFPIPLLSKRKPKDRFAFDRHARMADMILPLVIRRGDAQERSSGFSFSRMLGLRTVIRR